MRKANPFQEKVVKVQEVSNGLVLRTFWAIYDPDFLHWMSIEEFKERIWTKDPERRREFRRRREAEYALMEFQDWREAQEQRRRRSRTAA
jgi:hypothetical protein